MQVRDRRDSGAGPTVRWAALLVGCLGATSAFGQSGPLAGKYRKLEVEIPEPVVFDEAAAQAALQQQDLLNNFVVIQGGMGAVNQSRPTFPRASYVHLSEGDTVDLTALREGLDPELIRVLNRMDDGQNAKAGQPVFLTWSHRVLPGELLHEIAALHQTDEEILRDLNALNDPHDGGELEDWSRLIVPAKVVHRLATPIWGEGWLLERLVPQAEYGNVVANGGTDIHVVQAGDTLLSVARQSRKDPDFLRRLNRLDDDTLTEGEILAIDHKYVVQQGASTFEVVMALEELYQLDLEEVLELSGLDSPDEITAGTMLHAPRNQAFLNQFGGGIQWAGGAFLERQLVFGEVAADPLLLPVEFAAAEWVADPVQVDVAPVIDRIAIAPVAAGIDAVRVRNDAAAAVHVNAADQAVLRAVGVAVDAEPSDVGEADAQPQWTLGTPRTDPAACVDHDERSYLQTASIGAFDLTAWNGVRFECVPVEEGEGFDDAAQRVGVDAVTLRRFVGAADDAVSPSVTHLVVRSWHRVAPGETLAVIAEAYGTTEDALCALNGWDGDQVPAPWSRLDVPAVRTVAGQRIWQRRSPRARVDDVFAFEFGGDPTTSGETMWRQGDPVDRLLNGASAGLLVRDGAKPTEVVDVLERRLKWAFEDFAAACGGIESPADFVAGLSLEPAARSTQRDEE